LTVRQKQGFDPVEEAKRIIDEAEKTNVTLRLLGGLAIRVHCHGQHPSHIRAYHDTDFFGLRGQSTQIELLFRKLGYVPNPRYNYLHGYKRLTFYDKSHDRNVDVFLDRFEMDHELDFKSRVGLDRYTIPLTDLLLTKIQVVKVTEKDLKDTLAILEDHQVGCKSDKEMVDLEYITKLCSRDWGLYKSIMASLDTLESFISGHKLAVRDEMAVMKKVKAIREAIAERPKSLRWKIRARIGERMRWYQEVEEG
jgi:hypothetical protein